MSCFFALHGAQVTAVEINGDYLAGAQFEADKWHVADKIEFMVYRGSLDIFEDESFDIVFTKSVLILIPQLSNYLAQINKKLKANGKVIFVENARGNFLYHFLRRYRPVFRRYPQAHYFTASDLDLFAQVFNLNNIRKNSLPPIYLITGYKAV